MISFLVKKTPMPENTMPATGNATLQKGRREPRNPKGDGADPASDEDPVAAGPRARWGVRAAARAAVRLQDSACYFTYALVLDS